MDQDSRVEGAASEARFYRPELDGMRFLAFVAVFLHHAFPLDVDAYTRHGLPSAVAEWVAAAVLAGGMGVDFFFCLSAYLITELLLREHRRFGSVAFKLFLLRRALRIWPLYYAFVLGATLLLPRMWPEVALSARQTWAFLLLVANWECARFGYPASPIAPLWSVAIEEQFYLAWPIIVRVATPRRLKAVLTAMLVIAAGTRLWLVGLATPHPGIWCNTLARLDPICLGGLLAMARQEGLSSRWRARRVAAALSAAAAIVATAKYVPLHTQPPSIHNVWAYAVVALACAVLLSVGMRPDGAPRSILAVRPLVYLGQISYGLYVLHIFSISLVSRWIAAVSPSQHILRAGAAFLVTVLLAMATYHGLEKPFLRLKVRFARVPSRPE